MGHPLTEFREGRKQTLQAFASELGASKGMVWKWENGKAIPRPEYMRKIIDLSNGSVSPNDWYVKVPPTPSEAARAEATECWQQANQHYAEAAAKVEEAKDWAEQARDLEAGVEKA